MSKAVRSNLLFQSIKALIREAQQRVVRNVNTTMLMTYFEIGRMIVENEQQGKRRAEYARETLKNLSADLSKEFGRGYSVDNLQWMRKFYLTYQKYETVSRISFQGQNDKYATTFHKSDVQQFPFRLRCFVLFDLKIGKLTHQDIGQMQMYVNYYDRVIKTKDENPTIGIILCREENKTVIEFTLPENNKTIFAKENKAVLPSKAELKKQLT